MTTAAELDEIEALLWAPVNNWFTNGQLLKYQRLVQIAREGLNTKTALVDLERTLEQEREAMIEMRSVDVS